MWRTVARSAKVRHGHARPPPVALGKARCDFLLSMLSGKRAQARIAGPALAVPREAQARPVTASGGRVLPRLKLRTAAAGSLKRGRGEHGRKRGVPLHGHEQAGLRCGPCGEYLQAHGPHGKTGFPHGGRLRRPGQGRSVVCHTQGACLRGQARARKPSGEGTEDRFCFSPKGARSPGKCAECVRRSCRGRGHADVSRKVATSHNGSIMRCCDGGRARSAGPFRGGSARLPGRLPGGGGARFTDSGCLHG